MYDVIRSTQIYQILQILEVLCSLRELLKMRINPMFHAGEEPEKKGGKRNCEGDSVSRT